MSIGQTDSGGQKFSIRVEWQHPHEFSTPVILFAPQSEFRFLIAQYTAHNAAWLSAPIRILGKFIHRFASWRTSKRCIMSKPLERRHRRSLPTVPHYFRLAQSSKRMLLLERFATWHATLKTVQG
jgi:hypothetical protein